MTIVSSSDRMRATVDGSVATLTFHNPDRHNAVSRDMWAAIPPLVDAFAADDAVRVVVVTGAGGRAFVAGADISEFGTERTGAEATKQYDAVSQRALDALAGCAKPTIARIDGYCIGGGVAVALSCDIRIASSVSRFGIPAAKLGLGYGYEGVRRLVQLVGHATAREIFFGARRYDAAIALRMRLVNHVVEPAELDGFVAALAADIAANAPLTIAAAKRAIDTVLREESAQDLPAVRAAIDRCFDSADFVEGQAAFRDRRPPVFKGR